MKPSVVFSKEQLERSVPAMRAVLHRELGIHCSEEQAQRLVEVVGLIASDAFVNVLERRQQAGGKS